jgi:hypothetical protein
MLRFDLVPDDLQRGGILLPREPDGIAVTGTLEASDDTQDRRGATAAGEDLLHDPVDAHLFRVKPARGGNEWQRGRIAQREAELAQRIVAPRRAGIGRKPRWLALVRWRGAVGRGDLWDISAALDVCASKLQLRPYRFELSFQRLHHRRVLLGLETLDGALEGYEVNRGGTAGGWSGGRLATMRRSMHEPDSALDARLRRCGRGVLSDGLRSVGRFLPVVASFSIVAVTGMMRFGER